jgi:hypothetical protein
MNVLALTIFALLWIAIVYAFNSLIIGKLQPVKLKTACVYIATTALLGVCGEIFVDSVYRALFGEALWLYHVYPIHDGFTSYYAPVIWGILGFYLYLLHDTLKLKKFTENKLALLFAAETLIIELLANLSFLLLFHRYLFYYLPNDLWHLTSVQTLPFYLLAGFMLTRTVKRFQKDWLFFTLMSIALIYLLIALVD